MYLRKSCILPVQKTEKIREQEKPSSENKTFHGNIDKCRSVFKTQSNIYDGAFSE